MTYKAKLKELEELFQKNEKYSSQLSSKMELLRFLEDLDFLIDNDQDIEFRFFTSNGSHLTRFIRARDILISPSQESGLD